VREHEVYRFGAVADNTGLAERLRDRSRVRGESTATEMAASQPAAGDAPPATARKTLPRAGLVAGAVGALTLVGAVWSWTSTAPKPEPQAASVQQASALASAPKSIEEIAEREASKPAAGKSASKTGDTKLAMKAPEASTPSKPASSSSPAPASASAKASETVKPGTVKLAIQPWGEIYVDGSKRGISPPLKSLNLAPGKHRIEVRNSEFAPYKETIEVKSGGEATVQYVF
jgi:serine/threonine-protein kinase